MGMAAENNVVKAVSTHVTMLTAVVPASPTGRGRLAEDGAAVGVTDHVTK